ncbi:hypothetical protein [Pseudomonas chlororaphis]|uniref:hypothetical protein n=1 Tax=Pseudomonas chlororaphis TaxID=587753 RepID=UPI000F589714|nr:hypothetical protein [Pseudomonas chlororaphis]
MKIALHIGLIITFSLSMTACAKTTISPCLIEARELFTLLQNKPESYWLAVNEVKEAFAILAQADLLSNLDAESPEIDRLSQIAKQKIAIAEQAISDSKVK